MTETKPRPPPGALLLARVTSAKLKGTPKRAVQYYYLAVSANHKYKAGVEALKRLGKLH